MISKQIVNTIQAQTWTKILTTAPVKFSRQNIWHKCALPNMDAYSDLQCCCLNLNLQISIMFDKPLSITWTSINVYKNIKGQSKSTLGWNILDWQSNPLIDQRPGLRTTSVIGILQLVILIYTVKVNGSPLVGPIY